MKYRYRYIYNNGNAIYIIEKYKNNKWVFCFAEFNKETADRMIENSNLVEFEIKKYKIIAICILMFIITFMTYLTIQS